MNQDIERPLRKIEENVVDAMYHLNNVKQLTMIQKEEVKKHLVNALAVMYEAMNVKAEVRS